MQNNNQVGRVTWSVEEGDLKPGDFCEAAAVLAPEGVAVGVNEVGGNTETLAVPLTTQLPKVSVTE